MAIRISTIIICLSIVTHVLFSQETKGKCGIWISFEQIKQKKIGNQIDRIASRPSKQKSIISPRGLFRIHYDTSIFTIPALVNEDGSRIENSFNQYADSVAKIFDEVYGIEIEQYGFPIPAKDGVRGGGSEYDVYIEDISDYGTTIPDDDTLILPIKINQQYTAYMKIDNDFGTGFYTKGLDAVRVTAAHEFHHVIELSTTGYWSEDIYFYEMTATSLESTVYPNIRDYIQYVRTYFNNTRAWPLFLESSGYERALFLKMLIEKNGPGIINDIWTRMITQRPIPSLELTLQTYSTTLEKEFSDFSNWSYYSGSQSDSNKYFIDANLFPEIKYSNYNAANFVQSFDISQKAFSINYFKIYHGLFDSSMFITTNTNYEDVLYGNDHDFLYQFRYSTMTSSGLQQIRPNLFVEFKSLPESDLKDWTVTMITTDGIFVPTEFDCFPNPFNPAKNNLIFNAPISTTKNPELYIYSVSMDLIFSGIVPITLFSGRGFATWDGKDNKGNMVSSGIYFFYLNDQKSTFRGKFAVIR